MARGCIRQRSKGSWQLIWDEPTPDGSRKQRSKTITGTKRDAEREMTEITRSLNNGLYTPPTKQTLGEYLGKWLEGARPSLAETSYQRYEKIVKRYLIPRLGGCGLSTLRAVDIKDAYSDWSKEGLSARTIKMHHAVLHRALREAMETEVLSRNVAALVDPPAFAPLSRQVPSDEDLRDLLVRARGTAVYPALALVVCTGMRAGEVCALKWDDVDLVNKRLTVSASAARVNGRVSVGDAKTDHSRRTITLPDLAVEALAMLPRLGPLCFQRRNGQPKDPSVLSREIKSFCGSGMHAFRHAHASFLMRQGVHPKEVSERLGHSKTSFTMDVYQHLAPGRQDASSGLVDETLG